MQVSVKLARKTRKARNLQKARRREQAPALRFVSIYGRFRNRSRTHRRKQGAAVYHTASRFRGAATQREVFTRALRTAVSARLKNFAGRGAPQKARRSRIPYGKPLSRSYDVTRSFYTRPTRLFPFHAAETNPRQYITLKRIGQPRTLAVALHRKRNQAVEQLGVGHADRLPQIKRQRAGNRVDFV